MIDSYGGNLIYHGGYFVGGVDKKDYIEPNVVLRTQLTEATLYGYETVRLFTNDTPTATGEVTSYSPAWHSWGSPTVNDCYVYSALWNGNIENMGNGKSAIWKNTLTAKQDINKVWKGSDTPLSIYNVSSWVEQTGSYVSEISSFTGISPYYGTDLGIISICFDRTHSASEVKSSGYQLDCSHLRSFAVLKADLGSGSNAVFNNVYTHNYEGCYWVENLTAIDCKALVGGWINNKRGLFPYVIKNALFSIVSGGGENQALGCKYAINVSGASDDIERNCIFAPNLSGCHNVCCVGNNYVTTSTGYLFVNFGWWKTYEDPWFDWELREIHDYDWYICDTDGTRLSGGIIDSDVTFSYSVSNLPTVLSSRVDATSSYNLSAYHSDFKDSKLSGQLIWGGGTTPSGWEWRTRFSSCTFKNVEWLHNQGYEAGNGVLVNLPSAYTDTSGILRGNWTSARL